MSEVGATDPTDPARAAAIDAAAGGAFLFAAIAPAAVRMPEDRGDEERAIAALADDFVAREVRPALLALEGHDLGELRRLLGRMGELGLLGLGVPEAYGGLSLGLSAATLLSERLGPTGGVAVAHGAHAGLATLPLVFFGTDEQKRRYLPRLAAGEWIGAYALTEPGYGSDALNARTSARRSDDGGFVLNGEKQWITNAGIADLFTVFAQLEGQGFTAFLVESGFAGVSTGPEYDKMGLWSSSTRPLILHDVAVPAENLLGEPGRGHKVALGVLDINRLNLAAGGAGGARRLLDLAAAYAQGRIQFGRPIASFGLVREKLARIAVRTWALEACVCRVAGLIETAAAATAAGGGGGDLAQAAARYAIECAIVKVLGSEVLAFAADEALQIHGGNGYMREYEVERAYRDARIQRIFEGTNEINRLTVVEVWARKVARGEIPLESLAARLGREIGQWRRPAFFDRPLEEERFRIEGARRAAAFVAARALEAIGPAADALVAEEEVLGAIADMAIALFAGESALLRAEKLLAAGGGPEAAAGDLASLAVDEAVTSLRAAAMRILCHVEHGDARLVAIATLARLTPASPLDSIAGYRRVAARVLFEESPAPA